MQFTFNQVSLMELHPNYITKNSPIRFVSEGHTVPRRDCRSLSAIWYYC